MIKYDCHTEDHSRASRDHVGELKFSYHFRVEPSAGDTIYLPGDGQSVVWRIVRRHWEESGERILIVAPLHGGVIQA